MKCHDRGYRDRKHLTWNGQGRLLWRGGDSDNASHQVMSDSCHPSDCSLPGFSVNGILQERILEWVAIPLLSEPPGKPTLKVGKTISNWTVIGNNILSKKNSMLYIKGQKCVFLYNTFKGQIFHMRRKWDILWWRVRYYSELYIKTNSYWAIQIKMS